MTPSLADPPEDLTELGRLLIAALDRAGLSMNALDRAVGAPGGLTSRVARGIRGYNQETLARVASRLDMTPDERASFLRLHEEQRKQVRRRSRIDLVPAASPAAADTPREVAEQRRRLTQILSGARYPNLEIALLAESNDKTRRWFWAADMARKGWCGPRDYAPNEWPVILDELERDLRRMRDASKK